MRAGATERSEIRALASRVAGLDPRTRSHVSLVGFMAGALHALDRAAQLNYSDTRAKPKLAEFAIEFRTTLKSIDRNRKRPTGWLAGFYLHSAILRLDAVDVRLNKLPKAGKYRPTSIHGAVKSLKHDEDAHLSGTKNVSFSQTLRDAKTICERLESAVR